MATSKVTEPSSGCVVLRVKRKREEDPAEALVVAKQSKQDTGATSVFHFVGTVKEDDSDGVILDRLKHHKERSNLIKPNPLARLSLEDTRTSKREKLKAQSSVQRFKVTSQLRCLEESGETGKEESADGAVGTSSSDAHTVGRRVHICDVDQENGSTNWPTVTSGAVTCNDSVMLRERVGQNKGYVYDLYLTREPGMLDMESGTFDWSSLSVCESELVHNIIDDQEQETYDDEDDSNDEDNWRNDYPDEEGSGRYSDSDEFDPHHISYRDRSPPVYYSTGDEYADECGYGGY